jgi:hypothetical protein
MSVVLSILSGLAIAAGVLGTMTLFTFCIACGANSSPAEIRTIKLWMLAIVLSGMLCLGGGVLLAARGMPIYGSVVGAMPMIILVSLMVWLTISQVWKVS